MLRNFTYPLNFRSFPQFSAVFCKNMAIKNLITENQILMIYFSTMYCMVLFYVYIFAMSNYKIKLVWK